MRNKIIYHCIHRHLTLQLAPPRLVLPQQAALPQLVALPLLVVLLQLAALLQVLQLLVQGPLQLVVQPQHQLLVLKLGAPLRLEVLLQGLLPRQRRLNLLQQAVV